MNSLDCSTALIIARFRSSEASRRLQEAGEGATVPSALDLMTDSSEEDERVEEERKDALDEPFRGLTNYPGYGTLVSPRIPPGRFVRMPFMKNKTIWFVWDPCGIVCSVMTYILVLYGEFVMLAVIAPPFPGAWTALSVLVFTSLGGLAVVAHVKSMITDPVSGEERGKGRERCQIGTEFVDSAHTYAHTHTHSLTHTHTHRGWWRRREPRRRRCWTGDRRERTSDTANGVAASSLTAPTTAVPVNTASTAWTTTAPGQ